MYVRVLDAMNEVAWCYVEGFGCKKDKVRSLGTKTASSIITQYHITQRRRGLSSHPFSDDPLDEGIIRRHW